MKYQPRNKTVATSVTEAQLQWVEAEIARIEAETGIRVSQAQIVYKALVQAGMPERE